MFVAGWRHALRNEWPFINTLAVADQINTMLAWYTKNFLSLNKLVMMMNSCLFAVLAYRPRVVDVLHHLIQHCRARAKQVRPDAHTRPSFPGTAAWPPVQLSGSTLCKSAWAVAGWAPVKRAALMSRVWGTCTDARGQQLLQLLEGGTRVTLTQ